MSEIKLLLVDDEPELLEILEIIIGANFDAEIETACDGLSAIDKIKNNSYDAIYCDYTLPGANGIEVFNANKENNNHPFIIMSGENIRNNENYDEFIKANSINHYLEKPYFENDIVTSINKISSKSVEMNQAHHDSYSKINKN